MPQPCPSDDQLSLLAEGAVSGPALEQLEQHLDACVTCRQLLAAVSNGSTPLLRPTDRHTLGPGERLGRYEIERLLGAGGMGMLYLARDPQLGRRVALKLMRPSQAATDGGRLRLLREAQAMAQLNHPNVVSVFDLGEVDGRVFVAMELLEGGTLRDWMKKPHTWKDVVGMFVAAGEGLAAAHESGVVHRDFKPENVLVGKDERPKVGDFGLARPEVVAEEEPPLALHLPMRVTRTGSLLGTPAYMAPEQLAGRPADARSDQYGFCVTLYEALIGQRPFPADTIEELRARVEGVLPPPPRDGLVPAHVWAAIARGLNPDPALRFPDMAALLTVLKFPPGATVRTPRAWTRARLGLVSAGVLVGGAVAAFALQAPAPSPEAPTPIAVTAPVVAAATAAKELGSFEFLTLGTQQHYAVPDLARVAVGDPTVLDVTTEGDGVTVRALAGGNTTLLIWSTNGATRSTEFEVPSDQSEQVRDELTPADIMMGVLSNKPALERCFAQEHARNPKSRGVLKLRWVIETDGHVSDVGALEPKPAEKQLESCVGALIAQTFYPPHRKPTEPVVFPFEF